ncbi:low-density lipoprotein receptor-related protein 8-like [Heteronotia binoei]|uniref:low-density lipoprotein receptor-related protein 8-like n=1 Tax=Heteronotia binoei TaxID=13085 RepID=UPI00293082C7|nr:low-density lipoprotein receptor-related protein 8-like [Heteronotia binoei]
MQQLFFLPFFLTVLGRLCAWAAEPDVFNSTACSFPCENGGQVPLGMRCDGKRDCADGSDESSCNSGNVVLCAPDEWQCGGGGPCLPLERFCHCYLDCLDSSAELAEDCELQKAQPKAALPSLVCSQNEFQCTPGAPCFPLEWRCDGHADCVDERDEQNCVSDLLVTLVATEPESKVFPAKDSQRISRDPVYMTAIAVVALLIAAAAGVGVALWERRRAKHRSSSSSYKLADWFTA